MKLVGLASNEKSLTVQQGTFERLGLEIGDAITCGAYGRAVRAMTLPPRRSIQMLPINAIAALTIIM
jgi:hypothetical protein